MSDRTSKDTLAGAIEHTLLRPDGTQSDLALLCDQASAYGLGAICVTPRDVLWCRERLEARAPRLVTVVGFPLGSHRSVIKAQEAAAAVVDGADEIDMVIDLRALKESRDEQVEADISAVVAAASGRPVKVIIETCLLSDEQKRRAARIVVEAGAAFVKTSTGFSTGGATVDDIRIIREATAGRCGIKASGGIRTLDQALALMDAGATRIGTSQGHALMDAWERSHAGS